MNNSGKQKSESYSIVEKTSFLQQQFCYAASFNNTASMLIAGCNDVINVFNVYENEINKICQLEGHSPDVYCLKFMNKSNDFASGGHDNKIKIWLNDNQQHWIICKILKADFGWVECIIMNKQEDLLISGSADGCIRFWNKSNDWQCQQEISIHENRVHSIDLNNENNKLISCSQDGFILIFENNKIEGWSLIQKIFQSIVGMRLCFISEQKFLFLPKQTETIQVYEMNENQFLCNDKFQIPQGNDGGTLFPINFISSLQLLIIKHGCLVNLINYQNGQLKLFNTLDYGTEGIYGTLSNDGKLLVTWDLKSRKLKIMEVQ